MNHKDFLKRLGMEVRVARIRKGFTTKEVGNITGLHLSTINNMENGKCDAKILSYKRIADALELDMKSFL